jgi:hypothetical protein
VSASSSPNTAATTMRPWGPVPNVRATNPFGVCSPSTVSTRNAIGHGSARLRATPTSMSPTDNAAIGQ